MPDREKVIEGLEYLITAYAFHGDDAECLGEAIELLEPKKPEIINGLHYYKCGKCGNGLWVAGQRFCGCCGSQVKWDDHP